MPRIRIVEEWLRHPFAPATRWRSIMVVADLWAEQRVLMKAYAESIDQTRPTIVLHGVELAIGPAGTDPHGPWGIHVHPQVDGRAQEIAEALKDAARRVAGSKGNPARLLDEVSDFERKRTDNWAPGTPRGTEGSAADSRNYFEPMVAASAAFEQAAYASNYDKPMVVTPQSATYVPVTPIAVEAQPEPAATANHLPRRRRGWTSPLPNQSAEPGRTALGYESGAGAQSAIIRLGLRPAISAQLARLVGHTVPADFSITARERDVLNALGEHEELGAAVIGQMVGVEDAVGWMEALIRKLTDYGLDIVAPGRAHGGEPSYRLQR